MSLKKRSQQPRHYKDYKQYKPFLRLEFDYQCAYCGIREAEDGGSKKFHIDHYKPKKKFPEEISNYSNLFYSCSECNLSKGDYWPNFFKNILNKFILNPCDHDFELYYDTTKYAWIGKTPEARWNIDKLRLNSRRKMNIRKDGKIIYDFIESLKYKEKELQALLTKSDLSDEVRKSTEEFLKINQDRISTLKRKTTDPLD